MLFERFGEFGALEELNSAAKGLKDEGDMENLLLLAKENGIDAEDARDYMEGHSEELATLSMAAMGRLQVEEESMKENRLALKVIINMIRVMIAEKELCEGIMKKGKRAGKILDLMKNVASKHKQGNYGYSCGTDKQLQDIIRAYYTKGEMEVKRILESLY